MKETNRLTKGIISILLKYLEGRDGGESCGLGGGAATWQMVEGRVGGREECERSNKGIGMSEVR